MFDPARIDGLDARIGLRLGREEYLLSIGGGAVEVERGSADGAELVFTGPPRAVAAAVYGGVPIEALEADGALKVEGDRALAARFVTLFPLPPKVGV
jgi:hypothetical protein